MVEKTRDDLVREVSALRGRLAELERSKAEFGQAKRALKESEDRFWSLFGGAVEGILVVDIETLQVRYANPAICRMLGYSEEELAKLRVHDIHHEEDLRDVASAFEAQVRGEKPLATGIPFLRKDGTKVYADINSSKIIVDERACNVGFVTDITDRKKAERAQRESEELFRFLFQSTEDCVVIVDRDLKYIHANKASNDYLGYRDDTIEGKTID